MWLNSSMHTLWDVDDIGKTMTVTCLANLSCLLFIDWGESNTRSHIRMFLNRLEPLFQIVVFVQMLLGDCNYGLF